MTSDQSELERLRQWKAEATEVILGLQDLGRALGLRPGERITGPAAVTVAQDLQRRLDWQELDHGALRAADMAYCDEPMGSSGAQRVQMAITAYLWAMAKAKPHPLGTVYPSLSDWRLEAARLRAEADR